MTNTLMKFSKRFTRFLLFAAVVAVLGHDAHAQQNTITGYNQIVGQWDASQAARTNNSRTGTGSPVGREYRGPRRRTGTRRGRVEEDAMRSTVTQ